MIQFWLILGSLLSLAATGFYIRSMFRGEARPNRISWLMWALAPLIATAAGVSKGVTWAALPVLTAGLCPLLVFTFSLGIQNAYWKLEPFDYLCGAFSLLALILWASTKIADLAIVFAIASDGSAAIPTVVKSWTRPETENMSPFAAGLINVILGFLAVRSWSFSSSGFLVYLFVINIVMLYSLNRRRIHRFGPPLA